MMRYLSLFFILNISSSEIKRFNKIRLIGLKRTEDFVRRLKSFRFGSGIEENDIPCFSRIIFTDNTKFFEQMENWNEKDNRNHIFLELHDWRKINFTILFSTVESYSGTSSKRARREKRVQPSSDAVEQQSRGDVLFRGGRGR